MRRASGCAANAVKARGRAAVVRRSSALGTKQRRSRATHRSATLSDELHEEHRGGLSDVEAERFWEDRYRRQERVWSGRANPVLADIVGSLRPGTALDLGCREGGDAMWHAPHGSRVAAV